MVEFGWKEIRGHSKQRNSMIKDFEVGASPEKDSEGREGLPKGHAGNESQVGRGQVPPHLHDRSIAIEKRSYLTYAREHLGRASLTAQPLPAHI